MLAKAASVRYLARTGYRFAFELNVESVDNVLGAADVVCTWQRGQKLLWTPPCPVDKSKRVVSFVGGPPLRQDVTVFKKKRSDAGYESKVFCLAIRSGSVKGKVVGKVDLDFAEYTAVPSFSTRFVAKLSSGSRPIFRVSSRYLGEAKPNNPPVRTPSAATASSGGGETISVVTGSTADGSTGSKPFDDENRHQVETALDTYISTFDQPSAKSPGRDTDGGASRAEIERLRTENKALRRANDQLKELESVNHGLRSDVEDLKDRLSREPVYLDVVRDLREAKMALAILTLEREELQHAVRTSATSRNNLK
jgi:N-terminal C2 in EEIG1 and EHBP1 proteins